MPETNPVTHYDHVICVQWLTPEQILEEQAAVQRRTELMHCVTLEVENLVPFMDQGRDMLKIIWKVVAEMPEPKQMTVRTGLTLDNKPKPANPGLTFAPDDPLTAKRKREAFINAAFTREQQQAIGMILERWWSQKMAGIETQKVAEIQGKVDWLTAEVGKLRS